MATENEKPGMSPHDNASYFFVQADELISGLRAALDGSKSGRIDSWRAEVISELRAVIEGRPFPEAGDGRRPSLGGCRDSGELRPALPDSVGAQSTLSASVDRG